MRRAVAIDAVRTMPTRDGDGRFISPVVIVQRFAALGVWPCWREIRQREHHMLRGQAALVRRGIRPYLPVAAKRRGELSRRAPMLFSLARSLSRPLRGKSLAGDPSEVTAL